MLDSVLLIRDLVKETHSEISKFTDCTELYFRQTTLLLIVKDPRKTTQNEMGKQVSDKLQKI